MYVQVRDSKAIELATEVVSGVLFSLGLVYTGMVRPSKVSREKAALKLYGYQSPLAALCNHHNQSKLSTRSKACWCRFVHHSLATLLCCWLACCVFQVAAFLSLSHPAWDLSLAFVMGGALLVALPGMCCPISLLK